MMDLIQPLLDLLSDPKTVIDAFIVAHGNLVYALLFAIIFVETGLVVMPFLPGDSLLFVAGSLAAGVAPTLNIWFLFFLLFAAAVLGDNLNYWVGRFFGPRVVKWKTFGRDLVQQKHLDKTHSYFEKYGVKTIIIARFVPIVRTFAPFVAGIGKMTYGYFITYNIVGGVVWVLLFTFSGYLFGNIPFMKENFEYVIIVIILVSVLPMVFEAWKAKREAKTEVAKA